MTKSIQEQLSDERKALQQTGHLPEWFITPGWQMFKQKYLYDAIGLSDTYRRIARTAAWHMGFAVQSSWEDRFYEILWKGWLACSTPVLANMGTTRGCPVSCSGQYVSDSVYGFYENRLETAVLTKNGFGTSAYLGGIRHRGADISGGKGKASGTLPIFKMFVQDMRDVSQGSTRRGAWAGYISIEHPDFYEIAAYVQHHPDDLNIGWNIHDSFLQRLESGDEDALLRYQRAMKVRALTGKGYFYFVDKVARSQPACYADHNLRSVASNLCSEISLHSDSEHSFTCVLSSMNAHKYDEWKNTDAVFVATVFLDCVAEEFIQQGKNIRGLEKAVRFTEKGRALGLGLLGFHSYLQKHSIPLESLDAVYKNAEIFKHLRTEATRASQYLAEELGEPVWCKGYGVRNTHLLAIAPNTTSALICGGVSQGIEPVVANVYTQPGAAGELERINPELILLLESKGKYTQEIVDDIADKLGSVQHLDFLTDHEKLVFKTAYEIDQFALIRLAAQRQPFICQSQSLNLFFDADEDEEYISAVHQEAFRNPNIKSLYYMRGMRGVQASKGECVACEG
jgi:ribonucleoside-diphosphate reductase alpha chain